MSLLSEAKIVDMTEVSLNGVDEWLNYIESILDDTTYFKHMMASKFCWRWSTTYWSPWVVGESTGEDVMTEAGPPLLPVASHIHLWHAPHKKIYF